MAKNRGSGGEPENEDKGGVMLEATASYTASSSQEDGQAESGPVANPVVVTASVSSDNDNISTRVGSRTKKAKVVFDPSDNYVPRKRVRKSDANATDGPGEPGLPKSPVKFTEKLASDSVNNEANSANNNNKTRLMPTSSSSQNPKPNSGIPSGYRNKILCSSPPEPGSAGSSGGVAVTGGARQEFKREPTCDMCHKVEQLRRGFKLIDCSNCPFRAHSRCLRAHQVYSKFPILDNFRCFQCIECVVCGKVLRGGNLLFCAKCQNAFHANCHGPTVAQEGSSSRSWSCKRCVSEKTATPTPVTSTVAPRQLMPPHLQQQHKQQQQQKLKQSQQHQHSQHKPQQQQQLPRSQERRPAAAVSAVIPDQSLQLGLPPLAVQAIHFLQHEDLDDHETPRDQQADDEAHHDFAGFSDNELGKGSRSSSEDGGEGSNQSTSTTTTKHNVPSTMRARRRSYDNGTDNDHMEEENDDHDDDDDDADEDDNHNDVDEKPKVANGNNNGTVETHGSTNQADFDEDEKKFDPGMDNFENVHNWTCEEVYLYFQHHFPDYAHLFKEQEIDGPSLVLMRKSDVLTGFGLKLGPAIKLYQRIVMMQNNDRDIRLTWI
ncbi:uncharacterized protein LOC129740208 [Uranotaenia lowii]|uniref:uncharacterized protein LOC129740208 n=1 Tax=Uranotaenia lowii TaxID=190385 RepID=UPI0024797BED|nr:uncharacterized protein LOC129740208 [Uranotaenia lowii]